MNAQVELFELETAEVVEPVAESKFGLEQLNFVEVLVDQYERQVVALDDHIAAIRNIDSISKYVMETMGAKFAPALEVERLKHLLKVNFWNTVYQRSNISMFLDAEKREEWRYKLHVEKDNKAELPDFTIDNVTATVKAWYADRENMFMDRVDLVFRSLSKSHVTNQPEGFSKKMIFSGGCEMSFSCGMNIKWQTEEKLYDLECIICMLTNRPMPSRSSIYRRHNLALGRKHSFLGDAYQIQVFKSGTIHIWVHESLAIELNTWLAKKYPASIPSKHRVKTKAIKEYQYNYDALTTSEENLMERIIQGYSVSFCNKDDVERFLKFTGCKLEDLDRGNRSSRNDVVSRIALSLLRNGYPNIKDHQFYPTPDSIVLDVAEYLGGRAESAKVLEPSAGTGKLASIFNPENVTCVEVNGFFSEILMERKFADVQNMDFLKFNTSEKFDVIAMNPPYSDKRLESHLEKALTHLDAEGELVLIAPTGKLSKIEEIAQGYTVEIVKSHQNEFEDTTISTSIFSITK